MYCKLLLLSEVLTQIEVFVLLHVGRTSRCKTASFNLTHFLHRHGRSLYYHYPVITGGARVSGNESCHCLMVPYIKFPVSGTIPCLPYLGIEISWRPGLRHFALYLAW